MGPRIIRCGFVGGPNLFAELPGQLGTSGEPWWLCRGGHRLWASPEVQPDTYAPDNSPVHVSQQDGYLVFLQPVEAGTGLQKEIAVQILDSGEILVNHRIENRGSRARVLAPWALTAMAPGGTAITAFPRRSLQNHQLQPTNPLVMWSYTDFTDPRWIFTPQYLVLRHDSNRHDPQKAGLFHEHSLCCYLLGNTLFVKRYRASLSVEYPDFHSSVELFVNGDFLELETLGPLVTLRPDSSVTHLERWSLRSNVEIRSFTDEEIHRTLEPILQSTE